MTYDDRPISGPGATLPSAELRQHHLPGPEAGWGEIERFALTFDGYTHAGSVERCGEIANTAAERFVQGRGLPDSLDELRTCLFFEQRRWRHFAEEPDEESMRYIHALLEAVRERVRTGEDGGAA